MLHQEWNQNCFPPAIDWLLTFLSHHRQWQHGLISATESFARHCKKTPTTSRRWIVRSFNVSITNKITWIGTQRDTGKNFVVVISLRNDPYVGHAFEELFQNVQCQQDEESKAKNQRQNLWEPEAAPEASPMTHPPRGLHCLSGQLGTGNQETPLSRWFSIQCSTCFAPQLKAKKSLRWLSALYF